jgi:ribosome-binding factor A
MSIRLNQFSSYLKELLSQKIFEEFCDEEISISLVKTSPDLSLAEVYIRTLPKKNLETIERLNNYASKWQKEIFKKMRIKRFPKLKFLYDDFEEKEKKLIELLVENKENKEK